MCRGWVLRRFRQVRELQEDVTFASTVNGEDQVSGSAQGW